MPQLTHEQSHLCVIWASDLKSAVQMINDVGCAHLLKQMLPDPDMRRGLWLVFQDDSYLKAEWLKREPRATFLLKPEK